MPTRKLTSPLEELESYLRKLPRIGERAARQIASYLVMAPREVSEGLAAAILNASHNIKRCQRCGNFGEENLCAICADPTRDRKIVSVVASVQDLQAIERSGAYKGSYFVLHGMLAPLDGMGPEHLNIKKLATLIKEEEVKEVILATNPGSVGEATASYIASELRPLGVRITRIASGVPHGGELEYTDPVSIKSAMEGRREY